LDGTLFSADSAPDEDANNFRILSDINITFTAQLDGLPQAMFSVIGNRTGFEEGDAMLTIAYGGRQIVVTANIANNDATGSIVITNQDGVVITYDRSDVTNNGIITYNGTKYADIEEVNGVTIIRYIDGYFDSL
jgi:arginine deiminase